MGWVIAATALREPPQQPPLLEALELVLVLVLVVHEDAAPVVLQHSEAAAPLQHSEFEGEAWSVPGLAECACEELDRAEVELFDM